MENNQSLNSENSMNNNENSNYSSLDSGMSSGVAAQSVESYICFTLGNESFAMPLLAVKEVIAIPDITSVPQTPPYFLGIMNLRGQVISVLDLRIKLSIKSSESSQPAVIICGLKPNSIGVVVDSIDSVLNVPSKNVLEKPEIHSSKNTEYITGVYRNKEQLVLILDIAKALSLSDQKSIAKATSTAAQVKKAA